MNRKNRVIRITKIIVIYSSTRQTPSLLYYWKKVEMWL